MRAKLAEPQRGPGNDPARFAELAGDLEELRTGIGELLQTRDDLLAAHLEQEQSLRRDVSDHRRSESELRESRRFIAAILGALTTHVAVLDDRGVVIAVNTAWERFESIDRSGLATIGLGTNYLAACEAAAAAGSVQTGQLAAAIREILGGERQQFRVETAVGSGGAPEEACQRDGSACRSPPSTAAAPPAWWSHARTSPSAGGPRRHCARA